MVDVLIAVEDPGAANFVQELPQAFGAAGLSCEIYACGHASTYLRERGVKCAPLTAELPPCKLLLAGTSQNPDTPVLPLLDECRQRRIAAWAFVDMAADADLRFKGRDADPLRHRPDRLLVADDATATAFARLGFDPAAINVCGHPAYDRVRRRARALAREDRSAMRRRLLGDAAGTRPVWVFAAEHGDDARLQRAADYTLHGRGESDRRSDIVLEEVLDARAALRPRPFLVLRLHPKNAPDEFERYASEYDLLSRGGDALELLWVAALVIGMSSIILMEAALLGRPTLSVIPRDSERDWCPSVAAGLTPCAASREALASILAAAPRRPQVSIESDAVSRIVNAVSRQLGHA